LTEREGQILALMSDLLTNEEIARSLFVSVNTVRTHNRAILRKLGVSRRGDAVRRARQLGLLPPLFDAEAGEPSGSSIPAQRTDDPQL
jgi:LuxR family maltose regulon positive regulatory protein